MTDQTLRALAVHYVGRYATTRAKLRNYLARKIGERGWAGDDDPDTAALAEGMADLGYVDDRAFAAARAASLARRGYGARRLDGVLFAAGVTEDDADEARSVALDQAWASAETFARRRRIGPFAVSRPDRAGRGKALAAMMRAGHSMGIARRFVDAAPGALPDRED